MSATGISNAEALLSLCAAAVFGPIIVLECEWGCRGVEASPVSDLVF
jgi:hypothetical protein